MNDLRTTIVPKSDQLNADDLIGRTATIKITKVSLLTEADQPVALGFEGDNNKPYKPCKSMRRVLVTVWGPDGNAYIGRSMTIYRDDKVQFGGMAVGGIRISHMSNIDKDVTMALTATRANKKPFTVRPLKVEAKLAAHDPQTGEVTQRKMTWTEKLDELERDLVACRSEEDVDAVLAEERVKLMEQHAVNGNKARLDDILTKARFRDFTAPQADAA